MSCHVHRGLVAPENLLPWSGWGGDLLLVHAAEEGFEHARPVTLAAERPPALVVDVDAAAIPVPERSCSPQRLHQPIEVGALGQVAVPVDVPREAWNEMGFDVGDPDVGAAVQQLAEHLRAGTRIADDEERGLGTGHCRSC